MRYVWRDMEWQPIVVRAPTGRSAMIVRDTMDALRHPVTGKVVDSKSAFRRMTKDAGCVELGNDAASVTERRPDQDRSLRQDIHKAWQKLEQGYKPQPTERAVGGERRYG